MTLYVAHSDKEQGTLKKRTNNIVTKLTMKNVFMKASRFIMKAHSVVHNKETSCHDDKLYKKVTSFFR